jgi:hypothetical protein
MKCLVGSLLLVPYRRENFLRELRLFGDWFNEV